MTRGSFRKVGSWAAVLAVVFTQGISAAPDIGGSREDCNERMGWFRDSRFGMFIHWGLYAVPAGEWDGKKNHGEWIRDTAKIPVNTYNRFIDQFNPVKFDADEWARTAKAAGMKYMVITAKHHDGFCMWPSAFTDYDLASTSFKRDLLGELKEACDKVDIKFGFYYSIMDWHHPNYPPRQWEQDRPRDQVDMDRYTAYLKSQIGELIKRYDPALLWFDGEWEGVWTRERGEDLYAYIRELKPHIIVNNRVGKRSRDLGDFGTPEQHIPAKGIPGWDWETCMTMNGHWGYNKHDHGWKSIEDLLSKLVDISSKGGNFLLNVGPTAEGEIPLPSVTRLEAMGQWMQVNGESIYGTQASSIRPLVFGKVTQKAEGNDTTLYLHVSEWPEDGQLFVPVMNRVASAFLLSDRKHVLHARKGEKGLTIDLSGAAPDSVDSVVVVKLIGALELNPLDQLQQAEDGVVTLPVDRAEFGQHHAGNLQIDAKLKAIGHWNHPDALVQWTFIVNNPGRFRMTTETASLKASAFAVSLAEETRDVPVAPSGNYGVFQPLDAGVFEIKEAGPCTLVFAPVRHLWSPVNLRAVSLTPVKEIGIPMAE